MTLPVLRAHAFSQALPTIDPIWRELPQHCLLAVTRGLPTLAVGTVEWLLPPGNAAWVEAYTPLCVSADQPTVCDIILFNPDIVDLLPGPCRVFALDGAAIAQIDEVRRWGLVHGDDREATAAFVSLAERCNRLATVTAQFWLPVASSPELKRALAFAARHLAHDVTFEALCQHAQLSVPTLARRFDDELGMHWHEYQHRARMMQAVRLLSDTQADIGQVGQACGFSAVEAFEQALAAFAGESAADYRSRYAQSSDCPSTA